MAASFATVADAMVFLEFYYDTMIKMFAHTQQK